MVVDARATFAEVTISVTNPGPELKLGYAIEISLSLFCGVTRQYGDQVLVRTLRTDALRVLRKAPKALKELFRMVVGVLDKIDKNCDVDVSFLCARAKRIEEQQGSCLRAVKIAVAAAAVRKVGEDVSFQCYVDRLLNNPKVAQAVRVQLQGGCLFSVRRWRERFIADVLVIVAHAVASSVPSLQPLWATASCLKRCLIKKEHLRTLNESRRWALLLGCSRSLNLTRDFIGNHGAAKLADALCATTTSLNLRECGITDVSRLAAALQVNTSLTSLNLRANRIGAEGASRLATTLKCNATLKCLNLWAAKIGDSGATSIATALQCNSTLTSLNLRANNIHTGAPFVKGRLTSLNLAFNKLGDVSQLAAALEKNSTLTSLDLQHCRIKDVSFIAVALVKNSSLKTLNLAFNRINNAGAAKLADALVTNLTCALDLTRNHITDDGAWRIACALEKRGHR